MFIIGMTIVAMGTSAPECAVSISASLHGSNGMAISNVIGSNIFNLLVVCGVCALFQPLEIKKETLKREFPFSVLVAVIIGIMGLIGMKSDMWKVSFWLCFLQYFCMVWFGLPEIREKPEK